MAVPNEFPLAKGPYKIAIIGEAPGKDEVEMGRPFVGQSGMLLNEMLSRANITRATCFAGNICQEQPDGNCLAMFEWDGEEITTGLSRLKTDLEAFRPTLIVLLGNATLHAFMSPNVIPNSRLVQGDRVFKFPQSISDWRGSTFRAAEGSPYPGVKCLATFHPAFCLRAHENKPLLQLDLNRVAKEAITPSLLHPVRKIEVLSSVSAVYALFDELEAKSGTLVALDIEGYYYAMSCISIATTKDKAWVIPFFLKDGNSCWNVSDEVLVTHRLAKFLANPAVKKVWQNGMYDRWVLQYGFNMPVLGNAHDIMLAWWEKYCEFPKDLATQASILTDQPFYKGDRKSNDDDTFFRYGGTDAAVTAEIVDKLVPLVHQHSPRAYEHYTFNHNLLNLLLYIELRGVAYDMSLAQSRRREIQQYIYKLQYQLDECANIGITKWTPRQTRIDLVYEVMCWANDRSKIKKVHEEEFPVALSVAEKDSLTEAEIGYLNTALGLGLNIKSDRFKDYLYKTLALPPQYNKKTKALTTDGLALLRLWKKHKVPAVGHALEISYLRTREQMLAIHPDPDGRMRCGYNIVGTVSGRVTCYTSPTGSGYNLQTLPDKDKTKPEGHPLRKGMQDLVVADPGHYIFKCDLKGSDGWTIGAWLHRLGDSTMLNDLRNGIKPAQRVAYMLRHGVSSLQGKSLSETYTLVQSINKDDWDYFALKIGIWGICYNMGPDLLGDVVYDESDGKIELTRKDVAEFRAAVISAYRINIWHTYVAARLKEKPVMVSASGHCRRFYGHPREILGNALANEPQENTTYATNLAAERLWMDPENRVERSYLDPKGKLRRVPFWVEPLHQVHDALIGQFPIEVTSWAVGKIQSYFNNPIEIAGQRIVIPFDGSYGLSWGDQDAGKIQAPTV